MLTRRVLRDAQVRSLYSPPSREGGGRSRRDRSDLARWIALAERCSVLSLSIAAVPFFRAWRSGLRACLPNRRCSVRSRPPAPTCHRLVPRVRRFQRWTSRVELPLAGPNSRTKFMTKFLGRVAKLAKAPDFDSGYRRFESCRAYQFLAGPRQGRGRLS